MVWSSARTTRMDALGAAHRVTHGVCKLARSRVCGSSMRRRDAGVGSDGETAAEGLDALAHAAEAVALLELGCAPSSVMRREW